MEQEWIVTFERKVKRLVHLNTEYNKLYGHRSNEPRARPKKRQQYHHDPPAPAVTTSPASDPESPEEEAKELKRRAARKKEKKDKKRQKLSESNRRNRSTRDKRPKMTREQAVSLIPEKRIVSNVTVSLADRLKILDIMNQRLREQETMACRFRNSHTFIPRPTEALFYPTFEVIANTKSSIQCSICDIKILHGQDRCKLELQLNHSNLDDIINRNSVQREDKVDFCATHGYCIPCYAQYITTCEEGKTCVCFATCRDRGGCRQPGATKSGLRGGGGGDGQQQYNDL